LNLLALTASSLDFYRAYSYFSRSVLESSIEMLLVNVPRTCSCSLLLARWSDDGVWITGVGDVKLSPLAPEGTCKNIFNCDGAEG